MNGAESLLRTAEAHEVDVCFANPGTTELPLVSALDRVGGVRPVLGLHEAVCVGAADGYGRMTGRPALTLVHLGPGLADGLACLHNARRAGTPIVALVGDQATWHLAADAPLTTDLEAVAAAFSTWTGRSTSAAGMAADLAEAVERSRRGPVCLILPADLADEQVEAGDSTRPVLAPDSAAGASGSTPVDEERVAAAADALRGAGPVVLFLGGRALSRPGLLAADAIARATGCRLVHETFPARVERGGGLPAPMRLPHVYADAAATLDGVETVILVGAREPVSSFGYPGLSSSLVPADAAVQSLAGAPQDSSDDAVNALERLAERVAGREGPPPARGTVRDRQLTVPSGVLTPETLSVTVAAGQPEGAIVVDESLTAGFDYHQAAIPAPEHTCMVAQVGGAIGHGLPLATGAAIACPDRPVITLQADGSALYTIQALWTQAREDLDVTTVLCNNQSYEIVKMEMKNADRPFGNASRSLLSLDRPEVGWSALAEGLGVPSIRVTTAEELAGALKAALSESGPHFIEAVIRQ
ncbi:acetolactate synthase large subunit [Actinoallomurus sp. NPDC052308]|uniref:acetolactate synthase large subunit n=1 Tax=Actinoallomurus sp. NPDC052308 TaxID=3155530 RepID=UPI00343A8AF2